MHRRKCLKISVTLVFSYLFIKTKRTSKAKVEKKTDTGSPLRAPFSKLKYGVVLPTLLTQDCGLFSSNLIQLIKLP